MDKSQKKRYYIKMQMQNVINNWDKFINFFEKELSATSFDLWIKPLRPIELQKGCLFIEVPSVSAKSFIGKNYLEFFLKALKESFVGVNSFKLLDGMETKEFLKTLDAGGAIEAEQVEQFFEKKQKNNFITKYTFDNFIVGKSNQFVYAAAKSVSESPGTKFNPLFIYGASGLGKTHLLHSIGAKLAAERSNLNIVYATCEKFVNDYIGSLGTKTVNEFRQSYRNVDVLMIDDIQILINKHSVQEEFFHTFNDLYHSGRQIVLTSDRNPKELATLEERLKSRFQSGLIQDIQSPEYETRLAILEKKVQIEGLNITQDAMKYIAEKIDTNIRELEGFLQKVCFHASLCSKKQADLTDAYEVFEEKTKKEQEDMTPDKIITAVCEYFGVSVEAIKGSKRSKEIVEPRQIAVYLVCELMPDLPLASIGLAFGGRDHTTVIHSREKIGKAIKLDSSSKLKKQITDIKGLILKI